MERSCPWGGPPAARPASSRAFEFRRHVQRQHGAYGPRTRGFQQRHVGGAGEVQLAYSGSINGDGSDGTSLWTTLAAPSGATGGTLNTNLHLNPAGLTHSKADVTQQAFTLNTANPFVVSIGTQKGTVWGIAGNIYGSADVILGSNDAPAAAMAR